MTDKLRKAVMVILVSLWFCMPFGAWGLEKAAPLSFGTSSIGSSNYTIAVGMADILTKKGLNITAEAIGGADANIRALNGKKIDMAMLNSDATTNAFLGTEQFAKMGKVPIRILVQGQERYNYIIFRKASGIKSPVDLKGKKFIGRRKSLADIESVTTAMLKAYNIPKEEVRILETAETNEVIEALKTGVVDGACLPGGRRASNLMDLANSTDVVFYSFPSDKLDLMLKELGTPFLSGAVPSGTYKGQTEPINTTLLLLGVGVRSDMPEETAYMITKLLMESQKELASIHNVGKEWTMENTLKKPPVPFHPGAVKYFKEKGVWTSALDQVQREILKKAP